MIDHQTNYVQNVIDDFYVANKDPIIAVSVDMMDTGIDVPEAVNLVFFKMVRSKSKFWQMIGRGTRLCPDLFGPGMDKDKLILFDYCQNFEFFDENPDGIEAKLQESVKQKVFKRRLAIAVALQDKDTDQDLHHEILEQMHETVKAVDTENFIVRAQRRHVEMFNDRQRWQELSGEDVLEIQEHLTHLPSLDDDDEFARRFDLLILNLQLAIISEQASQVTYREQVRELASALEDKKAVPSVATQLELILELQQDEYWVGVTLPMLEKVRRKLRDLVKFIDKERKQETVYTDMEDELGEGSELNDFIVKDPSLKNYRLKVEKYIRENQNHITIHRLKNNQPITGADLVALENILFADKTGMGSKEDFYASYGEEKRLGVFVRSIVGLDRNAAKTAFGEFLASTPLSADQIRFVDQIVEHLALNGVLDPDLLFAPPFTNTHHEGVSGVFPRRADKVIGIVRQVNENAVVA